MKLKAELLAKSALTHITATPWEGLEDLTNVYTFSSAFPKPKVLFLKKSTWLNIHVTLAFHTCCT